MPNPAVVSHIEERFFRDLTARESSIAQVWLDDAWGLLLGRRPTLEADITAGTVSEDTVIRVLASMVMRVFANPEGKLEEQIDDYKYRRDSVVSSGALHVTSDELADISPSRRARRSVKLTIYGEDD